MSQPIRFGKLRYPSVDSDEPLYQTLNYVRLEELFSGLEQAYFLLRKAIDFKEFGQNKLLYFFPQPWFFTLPFVNNPEHEHTRILADRLNQLGSHTYILLKHNIHNRNFLQEEPNPQKKLIVPSLGYIKLVQVLGETWNHSWLTYLRCVHPSSIHFYYRGGTILVKTDDFLQEFNKAVESCPYELDEQAQKDIEATINILQSDITAPYVNLNDMGPHERYLTHMVGMARDIAHFFKDVVIDPSYVYPHLACFMQLLENSMEHNRKQT